MNFFKLYIGDYQRDTAHLSVTEHGAFLLMLQHYYATEKPLPTGKALHRMLRAQSKQERDSIDFIVSEFWQETPDGLINERADAELSKANAQAETNKAIAQAREARRRESRNENEKSTNRATNDQPNHSQTPDTRHQTIKKPAVVESTVVPIRTKAPPPPQFSQDSPNHHDLTKFSMFADWKPSDQFETLARISGLVFPDKFPVVELGEFKTYWITHDHNPLDQSQWEHKFIKNLLRQKASNSR